MTSVSGTGATGASTAYASLQMGSGVAEDKTSLGNQDFLDLLVKQMQYQDPSKPMDSSQIMQQTAALSSVQEMQTLAQLAQQQFGLQMRLGASSLVGKQVTYTDSSGATATGTVDSASFASTTPTLSVGGTQVALDAVSGIATTA